MLVGFCLTVEWSSVSSTKTLTSSMTIKDEQAMMLKPQMAENRSDLKEEIRTWLH